jgi:hypothetical protein
MYGVVRRYRFDPQASETIDHHVRIGVIQPVRETPGFIAYYWLDTGDGGVSFTIFEDKAGADEATRRAADYVRSHLQPLIGEPETTEGIIQAHAPLWGGG